MKPLDSMPELIRAIAQTAARRARAIPHPDLQTRGRRNAHTAAVDAGTARQERRRAFASFRERDGRSPASPRRTTRRSKAD
jgi:hypothetical protein